MAVVILVLVAHVMDVQDLDVTQIQIIGKNVVEDHDRVVHSGVLDQ
jgi:hypothetical protein